MQSSFSNQSKTRKTTGKKACNFEFRNVAIIGCSDAKPFTGYLAVSAKVSAVQAHGSGTVECQCSQSQDFRLFCRRTACVWSVRAPSEGFCSVLELCRHAHARRSRRLWRHTHENQSRLDTPRSLLLGSACWQLRYQLGSAETASRRAAGSAADAAGRSRARRV